MTTPTTDEKEYLMRLDELLRCKQRVADLEAELRIASSRLNAARRDLHESWRAESLSRDRLNPQPEESP